MARSILLIDDDPAILYLHSRYFQGEGWEVYRAMGGEDGLRLFSTHQPDIVLLDLNMPGMSGMEVLERLMVHNASVILLTANGGIESAVRAMQLGAENFLTKPVQIGHLGAIVTRAVEKVELHRSHRLLLDQLEHRSGAAGIGSSPQMRALSRQIELIARSDHTTVLLQGESGTGKGWVAQLLHARSPRARAPFVEINCAGLSASFLDSELFGHERGAFTDAKSLKRGLFEVANGGTLFLDEVGDLAPELQPKLLKVLESKTFRRLGGTQEIRTDVRLVAATNKELDQEIAAGRFREDLFYRLHVLPVRMPPLRERTTEDLLELIRALMDDLAEKNPRSASVRISDRALAMLVRFDWPGNVRQMKNVLEHALVMSLGSDEILPAHLPVDLRECEPRGTQVVHGFVSMTIKAMERRHIEHTLVAFGGNRTQAASALGISRATLHYKIRDYGLEQVGRPGPGRLSAAS